MAASEDELADLLNFMEEDTSGPAAPEEKAEAPQPKPAKTKAAKPKPETVAETTPVTETKTAAQLHIERLQAELNRSEIAPVREDGRPVPEYELTPEQLQIRELEDQLAKRKAEDLVRQQERFEAGEGQSILIHFLEDGLTALGRVWYRGQELEVVQGGDAWQRTLDVNGESWLNQDENTQILLHGKVMFRRGPWPFQQLPADQISAEERRRNRSAPIL